MTMSSWTTTPPLRCDGAQLAVLPAVILREHTRGPAFVRAGTSTAGLRRCQSAHVKNWWTTEVAEGVTSSSAGLTDHAPVQFLCEDMNLACQVGVGFELQFLSFKVVVSFGLLERRLAVLADHDER
jgi:hypothetical protein